MEDDDSTFGNDTLVPRKSIKKLIINNSNLSRLNSSALSTSSKNADNELVAPSPILGGGATNGSPRERQQPDSTTSPRQGLNLEKLASQKTEMVPAALPAHPTVLSPERDNNNTTLDDTLMVFKQRSVSSQNSSILEDEEDAVPHPAGIVLRRPGYFTMPSMEELADMLDDDGNCWVENFVVGRYGYGNVFFPGFTNVAGLNLDEISM